MTEVTLLHGNCLDVMPTLVTGSVAMVFADLPYGVTRNAYDVVIPFDALWKNVKRLVKCNAAMVFSATHKFGIALCSSNLEQYRYDLVWQKSRPTGFLSANKCPLRAHEQLHVFYKKQPVYKPQFVDAGRPSNAPSRQRTNASVQQTGAYSAYKGTPRRCTNMRFPISVQQFASVNSNGISHPAQKPVALLEWLIKTYTNPGDTVLDPVAGSGTTAIAAMRTGRNVICIEKNSDYFAVMQTRVADEHTRLKAIND